MLDYLIALLDYVNDFSCQSAKASHAVLLCRMEQGEISDWSQTDKTDRVRRANAQRHGVSYNPVANVHKSRNNSHVSQKSAKFMTCVYFNDGSCTYTKHHETKSVYIRHVCGICFVQDGKVSNHTVGECGQKHSKKSRTGHDHCLLQWPCPECITKSKTSG